MIRHMMREGFGSSFMTDSTGRLMTSGVESGRQNSIFQHPVNAVREARPDNMRGGGMAIRYA